MKKVTVVRQNRCDREMRVLLFGCYFIFLTMQVFIGETEQLRLVNGINMLLYLVFVPGFFFCAGYCFERLVRQKSPERGKAELRKWALLCLGCYFLLALAQMVIRLGLPVSYSFSAVLTMIEIPGSAAIFFSMALTLLLASVFYEPLRAAAGRPGRLLAGAAVFACLALLEAKGEAYALTGALVGASQQQAVPVLPYFAYFLFGIWIEEKKPGFQWKPAAAAGAVTLISLALYRTPLQSLCRVAASAFLIYLLYSVSEGISDLTPRFRGIRLILDTLGLVFPASVILLYTLCARGLLKEPGVWTVLLAALALLALTYLLLGGFCLFQWCWRTFARYFREKVRHKTAVYFLLFTVAFALLLAISFLDFIRTGRSLLWKADGISQYYPRAVYFARYIRELASSLVSGNFELPMYDFRMGLGGEVTYSLEPLYFLFALFGPEKVEFTYTLLVVLRFYLAGISISVFCFYFKKDYFTTFIASCVYVFCGFSYFGGARHTMFMIPMILFPLLIISMEEILRGKRWYLCTIFVALALFSNYYFLYMCTFGMGIYFLVRFFCQKEGRTVKSFFLKGLTICGSYLLGVAMSCIVLVTTFGLYVGSGRNGAAVIKTPSLFYYSSEWILRCFMSFLTTSHSPGEWLKLGYLPISFVAIVYLFAKKGRKELKILSVIAAVMMALPLSGFVLNGFSSISNRWCFMIALLTAYIVADTLPELWRLGKREKLICAGAAAVYGYLAFFGNSQNWPTRIAFVCLAITLAGLFVCQERARWVQYLSKECVLLLLTFAMVFVNSHVLFSSANVVSEYAKWGGAKKEAENSPLRAVAELEDDSFYRVGVPKLDYDTCSSSLILDYNSIYMFNSTFNGVISEYLEAMGGTGYSVTQLLGLSNRAFLNALASVKYYAYYKTPTRPLPYGYEEALKTEVGGKKTTVTENKYALPLGYTYREAISREELEEYDVPQRQEVLMQRVMLENVESQGKEGIETTLIPLEILSVEENDLRFTQEGMRAGEPETEEEDLASENGQDSGEADSSAAENGLSDVEEDEEETSDDYTLTITFQGIPNSETYLVLKNAVLEGDMSESPINLTFKTEAGKMGYKFRSDDDKYGTGQPDYVFNLGYSQEAVTTCTVKFDRAGEIKFDSLELYCQPMTNLESYTDSLKEDVLENVSLDTNKVSGTISLEEDKYLVLSIPYQKGWTALVDGQEAELLRANYMYMGLALPAGEHEITLTYEIPGVRYSLVIMPSAAVLFVLLLLVRGFRNRKTRKKA